jgi:3-hydroxyanthranilate 3,4-dioxygenase
MFILPSRIPHSPQRQGNSLGLVVERKREEGEKDALMWYIDFENCREKLFERYFVCHDLGKDLVPVVNEFKASQEFSSKTPTPTSLSTDPPCKQDLTTVVPDPLNLVDFIAAHSAALEDGQVPSPSAPSPPPPVTAHRHEVHTRAHRCSCRWWT